MQHRNLCKNPSKNEDRTKNVEQGQGGDPKPLIVHRSTNGFLAEEIVCSEIFVLTYIFLISYNSSYAFNE